MRISDWSSDVCSSDLVEVVDKAISFMDPEIQKCPFPTYRKVREAGPVFIDPVTGRSEEHTSALQSLMRISYAVFCLKKKRSCTGTHTHVAHRVKQTLP